MSHETRDLAAYVLAGGKSTRMGKDKALQELAGRPLIERAVSLARSVAERVKIVGDESRYGSFGEVVADVYTGHGPLGGIHAALHDSDTELNLILGVDLPFIEPRFLQILITEALAGDAIVTVPSAAGYMQTLCALYRKTFLPVADHALSCGHNKIDALFQNLPVRVVEERELLSAGFSLSMFRNLNTPEDWDLAQREFKSHPHRL